jgi:hypothetical protein
LILLRGKFSFRINNLGTFSALTHDIITDQSVKYKYIFQGVALVEDGDE